MIIHLIRLIFFIYSFLLIARVVGSWFPRFSRHSLMRFVCFYTDPYLNIFKRVIPPIGGVLDLSPLIGFFVLEIVQKFLIAAVS